MNQNITLDRADLLRLADALKIPEIEGAPPGFEVGWVAAVEAVRHIAGMMPELYGDDGAPVIRP